MVGLVQYYVQENKLAKLAENSMIEQCFAAKKTKTELGGMKQKGPIYIFVAGLRR